MRLELYIDRLVLDGLGDTAGRPATIEDAIAAELRRLIAAELRRLIAAERYFERFASDTDSVTAIPRLRGDTVDITQSGRAERQIGRQIARSVFGGIGNGGENGPRSGG